MVYRIYVEKKPGFDVEANGLKNELISLLGIKDLTGLRLLNRYDVEGIDEMLFNQCVSTVFSEPPVDNTYAELPAAEGVSFAVEYLPGQFDQRAASAAECIQLISQGERPLVRSARVYLLEGTLTDEQVAEIKKYVINPVEAREASLDTKATLKMEYPVPAPVKVLEGFNQLSEEELKKFIEDNGLAMDLGDIEFCQNKASTCKLIGMAAHFQGTFGLTPDHFSGYYCAMNNGCMELTQEFLDGAILYKQPTPWHHEQADAIKHIQSNLEYIPEKPYAGIVCSSLCNCNIEEPDVICLQLPTQAAFHLLACYVETDWQKLEFPFSGESNCADTWMRTMKDGKIGLSLGCRGDRATGALGYGDVRVTMTTEQLIKALDGCDTVEKNNILYPYNPTCLYKSAF